MCLDLQSSCSFSTGYWKVLSRHSAKLLAISMSWSSVSHWRFPRLIWKERKQIKHKNKCTLSNWANIFNQLTCCEFVAFMLFSHLFPAPAWGFSSRCAFFFVMLWGTVLFCKVHISCYMLVPSAFTYICIPVYMNSYLNSFLEIYFAIKTVSKTGNIYHINNLYDFPHSLPECANSEYSYLKNIYL